MNYVFPIFKRELAAYFATPLGYVFVIIFLLAAGCFTFYVGNFYQNGVANLSVFFAYHPWLYLLLVPAVTMRLWAEERRTGTMELLLTLPIPLWASVVGKFLAAWLFTGIALALTFPIWVTVNYLGDPDNGIIVASYIGSFLVAGAYLSIGAAISATTNNQVIAFIVSVLICFIFTAPGASMVLDFLEVWTPASVVSTVAGFSFLSHFAAIQQGVIDFRDILFFVSLIALFLTINLAVLDARRGG